MKSAKWMLGGALALCLVSGQSAMAQGNSPGHGNGKGHNKHDDDDRDGDHGYYYGHVEPCPRELEHDLPPTPPDCVNVVIGGQDQRGRGLCALGVVLVEPLPT